MIWHGHGNLPKPDPIHTGLKAPIMIQLVHMLTTKLKKPTKNHTTREIQGTDRQMKVMDITPFNTTCQINQGNWHIIGDAIGFQKRENSGFLKPDTQFLSTTWQMEQTPPAN